MSDVARNEQLVRQFFATLSTGDLEALRPLIHREGSWEVMATTVPGAGETEGGDAVIDDFLSARARHVRPGRPEDRGEADVLAPAIWSAPRPRRSVS